MKKTLLLIMTALLAFGTSAALAGCGGDNASSAVAETAAVSTKDSASETTVPHATNTATTAPATTAATKPSTAATTAPATKPAQTSRTQTAQTSRTVNNNNTNNTNNNSNQTNNNTNTNTNNNNNNNNNNSSSQQSSKSTPKPTNPPKQEGSFAASDAVFVYNDRQVALNSDMDTVLAALGEANSMTTAPSCIGVGEDKTYHYDGFTVTTYPRGDKDYVMEIKVLDAAIATAKGIRLTAAATAPSATFAPTRRTTTSLCSSSWRTA